MHSRDALSKALRAHLLVDGAKLREQRQRFGRVRIAQRMHIRLQRGQVGENLRALESRRITCKRNY